MLDVKTAPNLTVGYVMGTGDQVASFIEQLGAKVEMIGAEGLAWGDLSRYNTIVLGVRAYERRDDLRANNSRLLEYVQNGGTLIVQYNRAMINDAYGPYPAKVSNDRITDEHAPVQILEPAHPVFTTPNKITDAAWTGWVQERGLNFLGEKDSRYRDLVQLDRSVSEQSRRQARRARRGDIRQGPVDLHRARALARAAGRRRRRVSDPGEPDQPRRKSPRRQPPARTSRPARTSAVPAPPIIRTEPVLIVVGGPGRRDGGTPPGAGPGPSPGGIPVPIDRAPFPRNKPCGGGISVRVLRRFPYLARRCRAFATHEISRLYLEGPAGESTIIESDTPAALMIRRVEFDALLVSLAVEAGAEVVTGVDVVQAPPTRADYADGAGRPPVRIVDRDCRGRRPQRRRAPSWA